MKQIKTLFKAKNNSQLFFIFTTYGITGSLSVIISKPLIKSIGITSKTMHPFLHLPTRILATLLIYQALLLIVGTFFGQHTYFRKQQKNLFHRILKNKK
tara:strand:+ start:206 stop:502 length:297 start_codon:yes stop_codon:yes gene_type:complete